MGACKLPWPLERLRQRSTRAPAQARMDPVVSLPDAGSVVGGSQAALEPSRSTALSVLAATPAGNGTTSASST
jgi:hypothetical protein